MEEKALCQCCRKAEAFSPPVAVIFVYAPALPRGYPLLTDEDYLVCTHDKCESVIRLVIRAIDSHPATRHAGSGFTQAWVIFRDPTMPAWRVLPPTMPIFRA